MGAAAPPWALFGLEFGRLMLTTLPNVGVLGGRFGAFHEGMKHFPNAPLLSTYKRDCLLLIQQQHTRESIKEQEQKHHSMGLGPS